MNEQEIKEPEKIIHKGKLTGRYFGEEFLKTEFKGSDPVIKGLLWERDTTIILGKEKSCKTLTAQFMAMHLTCGQDFLGEFEIPEPCNVIYLQAEGKLSATQQNIKRMMKVVPADMRRFLMLYYPAIALDTKEGFDEIYNQIKTWEPLKAKNTVFFGDSLYMMMQGDMKDDKESKKMITNLRTLAEEFQLTNAILHHSHRAVKDQQRNVIEEGDNSIFGSFVWKAFPDHILYQRKKEHAVTITCDTQRSGDIVSSIDMVFNEPDPLFFTIKENTRSSDDVVINALKIMGKATRRDLEVKTGQAKTTVHNSLNRLLIAERVIRTNEGKEFLWFPKP